MAEPALYDLAPLARMALLGLVLAAGPLAWIALRHRGASPVQRLQVLTALTLFLTFDLVLFGAFTRLTDSGLGCPDWPGCYGSASPWGAREQIGAAQSALPSGPVTHTKAWIEMTHRYLATGVGVLITVMAVASWLERRRLSLSPWWASATLLWVCLQGAFGALTVTMKLYPAIVTAHLLGGIGLLALLALQREGYRARRLVLGRGLRRGVWAVFALLWLQIALGGWVSTNYAVLACPDFPTCHGSWWPEADFARGFTLRRELGHDGQGDYLPFAALTAIHLVHRAGALVVFAAGGLLAWRLLARGRTEPALRRFGLGLAGLLLWQLASGVSNVVLGWPLVAAVAHTGGAAALVVLLSTLIGRSRVAPALAPDARPAGTPLPSRSLAGSHPGR
ncbi:COX15/CtaA family protein [Caldimonas tepidiphila]|uniref:COX15/CtaA family protein n=1 Tax=Caldimonas tepidiphila TaxID=2315841 RepID=UPI000E5BA57F|nr:COX15/CtaA family protein [Caldimonas tepidiphila]